MKLDKRHMAIALTMLVASVIYNVWVFTKPRARARVEPVAALLASEPTPAGPSVAGEAAPAATDPTKVPPVVDVALDRPPAWRRNPFAGHVGAPPPADDPLPPPAAAEPELVVDTVLFSATRKLAMVNGRTARIGDRIGSVTVIDILPNAIVVRADSGGVRTIERRMLRGERSRS